MCKVPILLWLASWPLAGAAPAQLRSVPPPSSETEDIVVVARRSGIPVWKVSSPRTTIVLVGAIEDVVNTSRWDPAPLAEALVKSDRVAFPDTLEVSASPFAMIGYVLRWRKQATLPNGQTLAGLMSPDQFARLAALRRKGILKPGFERTHPFHLALALRNAAKAKSSSGQDVSQYARRMAKKHKLQVVPVARGRARTLADEIFSSRPESHLRCLLDAVALVEAGPGAVKARSDAWAERRVPEFLASPAERVYRSCWPAGSKLDITPAAGLGAQIRQLMNDPRTTLAVVSLESLASPGGVLDDLQAAGFDIKGPNWRA